MDWVVLWVGEGAWKWGDFVWGVAGGCLGILVGSLEGMSYFSSTSQAILTNSVTSSRSKVNNYSSASSVYGKSSSVTFSKSNTVGRFLCCTH